MQRSASIWIWMATACAFMLAEARAQTHAGQYEQADIEYGASLYASHCITCHGENGDLMPQINLRSGRFPNAPTDRELGTVIREGLPGTAMTPNEYNESEITALIAFVRTIGSVNLSDTVLGDAVKGRQLYDGTGECATCHRIAGRGPRFAPDLSRIGASRTAAALGRALVGGSDATLPINRPVRIVTAEGRVVNGRRLNEDTFTVQIVDSAERLLSLDKRTLREYTVLDTPAMPSYRDRLSESERADVVAYLLSLKGAD
jgi:putative heme-binding domain-containing protein